MKYIFVAGAPGSKWSSVVKNIYFSADVDQSDYSDARTYYHDASGVMDLMHLGAYYDPGMEFDLPEDLSTVDKAQAEKLFDAPFSGTGTRIVKSHIFCYQHNIDYLRQHWPDCCIVLVYRSDDAALGWWVKCGHFDITYPSYQRYYQDLKTMSKIIQRQNAGLLHAWHSYSGTEVDSNIELAQQLNLALPPSKYQQTYSTNDIKVKII
jgi:hypothetical protein